MNQFYTYQSQDPNDFFNGSTQGLGSNRMQQQQQYNYYTMPGDGGQMNFFGNPQGQGNFDKSKPILQCRVLNNVF